MEHEQLLEKETTALSHNSLIEDETIIPIFDKIHVSFRVQSYGANFEVSASNLSIGAIALADFSDPEPPTT